jgi:lipopolysaccharide biosynthesis glycosyltransferase
MKIKILMPYHKPAKLFKDDILTPIHVGRTLALKKSSKNDPDLNWMLENMIGDDTGENISHKNASYNEMTAIYWAWKNYDSLGNPDYIGFMHYRRHFIFDSAIQKASVLCEAVDENYLDNINYSYDNLASVCSNNDFVYPVPFYRSTIYTHYQQNHRIEDLDAVLKILDNRYPEFIPAKEQYIHGNNAFFYNMFILPKDLFFKYAEWIFSILTEYESKVDISGKRLFISERLTGIYLTNLMKQGYKGLPLSTMYIEEDHVLPVVFATDEGYAMPTTVTMVSILKNARETTFYDFYILVPPDFSARSKQKFNEIKMSFPRCSISLIDMGNMFDDMKLSIPHITLPTYYRLQICELLINYGKCIYLDSDIIVNEDLTEFFNNNIDDYYIAGVKAPGYHFPEDGNRDYCEQAGLPSIDQYINAGVLLMNLKKLRENNMTEVFMRLAEKGLPSQDQDVMNVACYHNIKNVHFRYNNMLSKYQNQINKVKTVIPEEEVDEALKRTVIMHFADRIKPWNDITSYKADLWWAYAPESPFYQEMLLEYTPQIIESYFTKGIVAQKREINKYKQDIKRYKQDIKKKTNELKKIRKSKSYKIGKVLTFFPRKLKAFLKSIKNRGIKSTLCLVIKKLKRGK